MITCFKVQKHKRVNINWDIEAYYTQEDYSRPNSDGSFPVILFAFDPATDEWSPWACQCEEKVASNETRYINSAWSVSITPNIRRELEIFNRNTQDVVVTYTTTNWGSGTKTIPANGSDILSFTEKKNETHFTTIDIQLGWYGTWWLQSNRLVLNLKN